MYNDPIQVPNGETPTVESLLRAVAEAGRLQVTAQQHADELKRANAALSRSTAKLVSHDSLGSFLSIVLEEAVAAVGAVSGAIFLHEPEIGALRAKTFFLRGDHIDIAHDPRGKAYREPMPEQNRPWEIMSQERQAYWIDYAHPRPDDWPQSKAFHDALGHRFVVCLPMIHGEDVIGFIGLAWDKSAIVGPSENLIEVGWVLAQQATLAVRMTRLAEEARHLAIAREQHLAAQERAQELAKSNQALQESIDALGLINNLNDFLPTVLGIIGRTFGAVSCAYFEHSLNETVFLRYWNFEGRIHNPDDLLTVDPIRFDLVKQLAAGFKVPEDYLGTSVRQRTRAVIVDHKAGTSVPVFDAFAVRLGWDCELNVPLVVNGVADGAICIYQSAEVGFSAPQIELAETLAKQLAMALAASRIAERERAFAIAREQEQAAKDRAAELARANATVSRSLAAVSQSTDFDDTLEKVFLEIVAAADASAGQLFLYDVRANTLATIVWTDENGHGRGFCPDSPLLLQAAFDADVTPAFRLCLEANDIFGVNFKNPLPEQASLTWPGTTEWHLARGRESACAIPILVGQRPIGVIGLAWKNQYSFSKEQRELLFALTNQAAMVMQLRELADSQRAAAIAREREQAARQKADELAKANAILTLRDRLLNLVADASRELIQAPDLIAGIHSLLRRMGESTRLSRVLFFLQRETVNGGREHYVVTEWCAPGIADHHSLGIEVIPNSIAKPFLERMKNLSGFWIEMREVEEPMRSVLAPLKIVSTGCAPVMVGGEYAGVIAFDDCTALRSDDSAHVDAFLAVANFIGAALQRDSSQRALLAEQRERASLEAKALNEREAAIFQERTRFAGQIHDTLAQGFTGTLLHLEALRVRVARGERVTVEELQNVRKIAALGLAEARRSALAIRPLALDGRDLSTALQQLTERSAVPGILDCRWCLSGIPRPLSPIVDEALLNIAHEALSNAIRHADASNILITLAFDSDGVTLLVRDDGIGFDASDSRLRGHTFGLRSMSDRAEAVGGKLTVLSKHGEGTTVTVHLWNP